MPCRFAFTCWLVAAMPVMAQPVALIETAAPGECANYTIDLTVNGQLVVGPVAARDTVKLEARARHVFTERTLLVDGGMPKQSARHYETAQSLATVGADRIERTLAADRRVIIARRDEMGLFCFALAGPITRDELDLVAEHFNPQCLPGLLPGKELTVNETWSIRPAAVQSACQFDTLLKHNLQGKLVALDSGRATFTIAGQAEGIEHGSKAVLQVIATGTFDTTSRRVVELQWKQKDDRESSAIGPASQVEATIHLKRTPLPQVPASLTDAALSAVPKGNTPVTLTQLRFADPKGRYSIDHPREWHVTGETDSHLILRLVERDTFIAQATIAVWQSLPPGRHLGADEFKKAIAAARGWTALHVLDDREIPVEGGRWVYRYSAEGTLDGQAVVQSFYLIASPRGEQIVVVFTMKPDRVKTVGTRDLDFVKAIEFGGKK